MPKRKPSPTAPRGDAPASRAASEPAAAPRDAERDEHAPPKPATRAAPLEEELPSALLEAAPDFERSRELAQRHTAQRHAEIHGLFEILASKRRLFWINFLAGLSRGIGFFLGVTLVGGMLIGALAIAFDFVASTVGLKELRFSSMVASLAEKYFEAEKVWTSVENDPDGAAPHERELDDADASDEAAATDGAPATHDGTPTTSDDALEEDG